jgi:hypothetical protein
MKDNPKKDGSRHGKSKISTAVLISLAAAFARNLLAVTFELGQPLTQRLVVSA